MKEPSKEENLMVVTRIRPLNKREIQLNSSIILLPRDRNVVSLMKGDTPHDFYFDQVFGIDTTQEEMYEKTAFKFIQSTAQGFNSTILAYGQTGCGKSFSMLGCQIKDKPELIGIIPRSFLHFFDIKSNQEKKSQIRVSFIQIYNQEIKDLLSLGKNVETRQIKQDPNKGVFVRDLVVQPVESSAQMLQKMKIGEARRTVGSTKMNAVSSRSHCIFTVYYQKISDQKEVVTGGKLNFVDLAGSQRQSKTGAQGDRLKEANKINMSLTALGNVINALVEKKTHIPYRDSKLTRLLQDSLGGNSKTLLIAATSPSSDNYDETLSTLRYASRARKISNKPKVNQDPKDTLIKQYQQEIQKLKKQLESGGFPSQTVQNKENSESNQQNLQQINLAKKERDQYIQKNKQLLQQLENLMKVQKQLQVTESKADEPKAVKAEREQAKRRRKDKARKIQEQLAAGRDKQKALLKVSKGGDLQYQRLIAQLKSQNQSLQQEKAYQAQKFTQELKDMACENDLLWQIVNCLLPTKTIDLIKETAKKEVQMVRSYVQGQNNEMEWRLVPQIRKFQIRPFILQKPQNNIYFPDLGIGKQATMQYASNKNHSLLYKINISTPFNESSDSFHLKDPSSLRKDQGKSLHKNQGQSKFEKRNLNRSQNEFYGSQRGTSENKLSIKRVAKKNAQFDSKSGSLRQMLKGQKQQEQKIRRQIQLQQNQGRCIMPNKKAKPNQKLDRIEPSQLTSKLPALQSSYNSETRSVDGQMRRSSLGWRIK